MHYDAGHSIKATTETVNTIIIPLSDLNNTNIKSNKNPLFDIEKIINKITKNQQYGQAIHFTFFFLFLICRYIYLKNQ